MKALPTNIIVRDVVELAILACAAAFMWINSDRVPKYPAIYSVAALDSITLLLLIRYRRGQAVPQRRLVSVGALLICGIASLGSLFCGPQIVNVLSILAAVAVAALLLS